MFNKLKKFAAAGLILAAMSCFAGCQPAGAAKEPAEYDESASYKERMIDFIAAIGDYSRTKRSDFKLITNNGLALYDVYEVGTAYQHKILDAVDGALMEGYFYSWIYDDNKTPRSFQRYLDPPIAAVQAAGKAVLNIDYCANNENIDRSLAGNRRKGFIGFSADQRELDTIPAYPAAVSGANSRDINTLKDASNMLVLLNPERFRSRRAYIDTLAATDYDVMVIDAYFDDEPLRPAEVQQLQQKPNGGRRLVISYLSIGEAEDYRPYWREGWNSSNVSWLAEENEDWGGNYKVRYWQKEWQNIVFGSPDAGLDIIINAGFDGIFMDIVDAFEYFEEME